MSGSNDDTNSGTTVNKSDAVMEHKRVSRTYPVEMLSHWEHGFPEFQASSQAVYEEIEDGIRALELPGVSIGRSVRRQGGLFSRKREYLSVKRERLIIEICAAPFGPKFFFVSWRLSSILVAFDFLHVILSFFISVTMGWSASRFWGGDIGVTVGFCVLFSMIMVKAGEIHEVIEDVHNIMRRTPFLGQYWEFFVRPETYYRVDSAGAFRGAVHRVVLDVVDNLTKNNGVSPLSGDERKPVLAELSRRW